MLLLPELQHAASQLGKWRYFLTGVPFAVLFGLICRAAGKLIEPLGMWRRFRGTCTGCIEENGQYTVLLSFTDAKHLHHNAAFCTSDAVCAALKEGDAVDVAICTEIFLAGSYADDAAHAAENNGMFLLLHEHRAWLRRTLLSVFLRELLICGIALGVFVFAMKVCFP